MRNSRHCEQHLRTHVRGCLIESHFRVRLTLRKETLLLGRNLNPPSANTSFRIGPSDAVIISFVVTVILIGVYQPLWIAYTTARLDRKSLCCRLLCLQQSRIIGGSGSVDCYLGLGYDPSYLVKSLWSGNRKRGVLW
jgi:hypothetical protein